MLRTVWYIVNSSCGDIPPSYPSVHRSLVMAFDFCSAEKFYHFKAEHLFTSNPRRKSWYKRINKNFIWRTLEEEINFLKPEVFIAGEVLAQWNFNLWKQSGCFCWFDWQLFLGGVILYMISFCFALLCILHWVEGRRPDWSVAEQVLTLLFCGLTLCTALWHHTCFFPGNLFLSLGCLQALPWVFCPVSTLQYHFFLLHELSVSAMLLWFLPVLSCK